MISFLADGRVSLESGPEYKIRTSRGHGFHNYTVGCKTFDVWLHHAGDDASFWRILVCNMKDNWWSQWFGDDATDVYLMTHVAIFDKQTNNSRETYPVEWASIKIRRQHREILRAHSFAHTWFPRLFNC